MSLRVDYLDVPCPRCGQRHRYTLSINRSLVMHNLATVRAESKILNFTRLLTCPAKDEDFQIEFTVVQRDWEYINDIVAIEYTDEEGN